MLTIERRSPRTGVGLGVSEPGVSGATRRRGPRAFGLAMVAGGLLAATNAANAQCVPDWSGNGTTDIFDLIGYLESYSSGNLVADLDHDGENTIFDILAYLEFFSSADALIDSDNDGLPDAAELGDGVYYSPCRTGTDAFNPDTDGDGLSDGDEVLGTADGLDLPALGANPLRKDIFIECDWFAGSFGGFIENYRPIPAAVARVEQMFANAPLMNPDGSTGVSIHFDYGQGGPYTGGNQIPGTPLFVDFGPEFTAYKSTHFASNRKGYFHYAMFAHRHSSSSNRSSGIAEINGDDLMVTMVDYLSTSNQANTIAHELGHNLGLRHGGFENTNRKPNYNSVMNYRHQFPGVDDDCDSVGDGVLDYSWGFNQDLNENALIESQGVCGDQPIDWNRNGFIDAASYSLSINCSGAGTPCGVARESCYDSSCDVLSDWDDWSNIRFDTLVGGDRQAQPPALSRNIIECDNWPGKLAD